MRKFFVLLTLLVILSSMALFCWYYLKSISPNQTNSHIETIKIRYEPSYHFSGIQSPTQITKLLLETDKGYIHNWFIKNNDAVKNINPSSNITIQTLNVSLLTNKNIFHT